MSRVMDVGGVEAAAWRYSGSSWATTSSTASSNAHGLCGATAEDITAWSRDPQNGLTGYRVPKQVEFRDSLPETLVGKVLRRVLLEEEKQRAESVKS